MCKAGAGESSHWSGSHEGQAGDLHIGEDASSSATVKGKSKLSTLAK